MEGVIIQKLKLSFLRVCLLNSILLSVYSCAEEQAVPVTVSFEVEVVNNDSTVPVQVNITNTTEGADTYNWTFIGGNPSQSTDRNPGTITYTEAGDYSIVLEASNQDGNSSIKTLALPINAEIIPDFTATVLENNFPPVTVAITNTTSGASIFDWMFQNGTPSSATHKNPETIVFNSPGTHTITLKAGNGTETQTTTQEVVVAPHLEAAFNYTVAVTDNDLQVPVTLMIENTSTSATEYEWTFLGGTPERSTAETPSVSFDQSGTYTLVLKANNGKTSETLSKNITLLPNTNLRTFENVQLGINTAHSGNTVGAFFSTETQEVYTANEVNSTNGGLIDIVFFGLNSNFDFNTFTAASAADTFTFNTIPNATQTTFINVQETCNCAASLSVATFDAMTDDTPLRPLNIVETPESPQEFDANVLPRIVLFETQDGRKGAIKINAFVENGADSYISVDIKVQKA